MENCFIKETGKGLGREKTNEKISIYIHNIIIIHSTQFSDELV